MFQARLEVMSSKPRLLFVVTEDWYFVAHWLRLAQAARHAGFKVGIATRVSRCAEQIQSEGIDLLPLRFMRRSSRHPCIEFRAVRELTTLYQQWRPTIAHTVAAKPIIYGGMAALRAHVPAVVSSLAGLGFVFTSSRPEARVLRPFIVHAYRNVLRHPNSRLIVQNDTDLSVAIARRLTSPSAITRIPGSGVDVEIFAPRDESPGPPIILMAARMLVDKGVHEFVRAAQIAKSRGVRARFVLVGDTDSENPAAISNPQIKRWHAEGHVEWWGHRDDMSNVLNMAHVVCLPSYREGLSTVLLEAAACGRPLIASDVPGCREIVIHKETGLLVPPRDATALADAMQVLAADPLLRHRLGQRARELVCSHFTVEHVNGQTIAVYRELLDKCEA